MRSATAFILIIAQLAACSAAERETGDLQATITDSAGITIVQNHRPAWAAGEEWRVSEQPLMVIADTLATGEGRYILAAARLTNGEVVILTDQDGRWFDRQGALLRRFARSGEGPGEFRYASTVWPIDGDSVVVAQIGPATRIAWFGPDGMLARERRIDYKQLSALGRWAECEWTLLPDYSLTGCQIDATIPLSETNRASRALSDGVTSPGPGLLRQLRRIHRVSPGIDSTWPLGIDIGLEQYGVRLPDGNETFILHPFHSRSFLAAGGAPLRIAIASNPAWQIELWTPDGKLERIVRLDGGRRAPTDVEVGYADSLMRSDNDYYSRNDPVIKDRVLSELPTPDSLPGHQGLVVSSHGEVINREWTIWRPETPSRYTVFDPNGRWLGDLALPGAFRLLAVGEDYLLGISRDADDVQSVVVYGLER